MKELILFTLLSSFTLSFIPSKKVDFRPPGTVRIVDNFFFDETEITNISWKEYVYYLKEAHGETSAIYKAALPDTTVWTKDNPYLEPYVNTYFSHPSYDDYPVVGVSYDQAKAYCVWRTKAVKQMMKSYDKEPVDFEYRLPTRTEWELIASAGFSDKQKKSIRKFEKKKNYRGALRTCNMVYGDSKREELTPEFRMLTPSRVFLPNKYNIYSIYGNVAEMVEERNVAMGGSFLDSYHEIVPSNKALSYEGPARWLGFRCVGEVF